MKREKHIPDEPPSARQLGAADLHGPVSTQAAGCDLLLQTVTPNSFCPFESCCGKLFVFEGKKIQVNEVETSKRGLKNLY